MVGRGGLEPPTSRLSGVRSNHLSYRPEPLACFGQSLQHAGGASPFAKANRQFPKSDGLRQSPNGSGGAYRDRTDDLLNANQALSQLS